MKIWLVVYLTGKVFFVSSPYNTAEECARKLEVAKMNNENMVNGASQSEFTDLLKELEFKCELHSEAPQIEVSP